MELEQALERIRFEREALETKRVNKSREVKKLTAAMDYVQSAAGALEDLEQMGYDLKPGNKNFVQELRIKYDMLRLEVQSARSELKAIEERQNDLRRV